MYRTFFQKLNTLNFRGQLLVAVMLLLVSTPTIALAALVILYSLSVRLPTSVATLIGIVGMIAYVIFVIIATSSSTETPDDEEDDDEACDQALCPCVSHTQPPYYHFESRKWLLYPCSNEQCPCIEHTQQEEFSDGKWIISE